MVRRRRPGDGGAGSRMGEAGEEREGRERGGRLVGGSACGVGPSGREKRRAESLWVDQTGAEGPTGRETEGEGAAAMRGPWGLS
jgi:hypothetical protein